MLLLILYWMLCAISYAEIKVRCGSDNEAEFTFKEAGNVVHGRYQFEWCFNQTISEGDWTVYMEYSTAKERKNCNVLNRLYDLHSHFNEHFVTDLKCEYLCLLTNLDLIFNGTCYRFYTSLKSSRSTQKTGNYYDYVYNEYTINDFNSSKTVIAEHKTENSVIFDWFLNLIPASNYTMTLCTLKNIKEDCDAACQYRQCKGCHKRNTLNSQCTPVTHNCTNKIWDNRTKIECQLQPPVQNYTLELMHNAPWCSAIIFKNLLKTHHTVFTPNEAPTPPKTDPPASAGPWLLLGGGTALVLLGTATLLAYRWHLVVKLRERVDREWRTRTTTEAAAGTGGVGMRVLLLYARDCAPMMAVAGQLRALLRRSADHVYDLYSPEVVREAARAPGEWVRRVVARQDVRVVLLQTPAAACLHAAELRERGAAGVLRLEQPLLARRMLYRAPHSSDALLPLALRLLTDTAYTTLSYKKFYITTIEGLEAELVAEVTPRRRYLLPAAAHLLLQELSDGTLIFDVQLETQIQKFRKAVEDLHEHVRVNPNYLDEELIFFDYDQ